MSPSITLLLVSSFFLFFPVCNGNYSCYNYFSDCICKYMRIDDSSNRSRLVCVGDLNRGLKNVRFEGSPEARLQFDEIALHNSSDPKWFTDLIFGTESDVTEFIDFSNNNFSQLNDLAFLKRYPNLKRIDLSNNQLNSLPPLTNKNLEFINVSHNYLSTIELGNHPSLKKVDLSFNRLTYLDELIDLLSRNVHLVVTGNRWKCDKKLLSVNDQNATLTDFVCKKPAIMKGMSLKIAKSVLSTKKVCAECECNLVNKGSISVNCLQWKNSSLPIYLPINTGSLNLTGNKIRSFNIELTDREEIRKTNWQSVQYLYLKNNEIRTLRTIDGNPLIKKLVLLDLRDNQIEDVPLHILEQLTHLDRLYLSLNPWKCDCNTISFQSWLQKNFVKVSALSLNYLTDLLINCDYPRWSTRTK